MDLNERLDHYPEAWKPEPGDKIVGRVVSVTTLESKFGGSYPLISLVVDDNTEIAFMRFTPLRNPSSPASSRDPATCSA